MMLAESVRRLPSNALKEYMDSLSPEINSIQRELAVREGKLARLQAAYEEAVTRERELNREIEQLRQREADLAAIYHQVAAEVERGLAEEQARFHTALENEAIHHREVVEAEDRRHRAAVESEENRRQEAVETLQRRRSEALKALEDVRQQISAIGPNPCPTEIPPARPLPALISAPQSVSAPITTSSIGTTRATNTPLNRLMNLRAMRLRGLANSINAKIGVSQTDEIPVTIGE